MNTTRRIRVGLYGTNGHQVQHAVAKQADAELTAVAGFAAEAIPPGLQPKVCGSLDELLAIEEVELISLCSPRRCDQGRDAVKCLRAGKHVYAEKPCATTEADLDSILLAARETGCHFHEMAGTVVEQPYMTLRRAVRSGAIGEVVQVLAQKSYPWHDRRPSDEAVDGGLAMQAGIYALRFVEHIAGVKVASIRLAETAFGNPLGNQCRMACSMLMTLENGGVASAICNYLNPLGRSLWGYEIVRIFGTQGLVESNMDGKRARLIQTGREPLDLDQSEPSRNYFDCYVEALLGRSAMPLTTEEELSCTRWVIRAKQTLAAAHDGVA